MQVSEKRGAPEAAPKSRGGKHNKHTPPVDLEQRLRVTEELMAKLRAENAELKAKGDLAQTTAKDLQSRITELESTQEKKSAENAELKLNGEQAQSSAKDLQSRIAELETVREKYAVENSRLEEENVRLKTQEQQIKESLAELSQRINSLEAGLNSKTEDQLNLEAQLRAVHEQIGTQPEHLLTEIGQIRQQMGASAKKLEDQLPRIRGLVQEHFIPDASLKDACEALVKSLTEDQKAGLDALESFTPKFQKDLATHREMLNQHNIMMLHNDQLSRDLTYAANILGVPYEMHLISFEVLDIYERLEQLLKTDFLTIDDKASTNISASMTALAQRCEAAKTKFKALRTSEQTKALFDQLANSAAKSGEKGYFFFHFTQQEAVISSLQMRVDCDKSRYLQMRTTLTKQWNDTVRGFTMIENAIFLLAANIDLSVPLEKIRDELTRNKDHMRKKRLDIKKAPKEDDPINIVETLRSEIPKFKTIREAKNQLKGVWDAKMAPRKDANSPKTLHELMADERELKKPELALCLMDKSVDPDIEAQSERMHRAILKKYEHLKVKVENLWTMVDKAGQEAAEELMLLHEALLANGGFSRKITMSIKTTAAPWSLGLISVPPFLDYWNNPEKDLTDIEKQLTDIEKELTETKANKQ